MQFLQNQTLFIAWFYLLLKLPEVGQYLILYANDIFNSLERQFRDPLNLSDDQSCMMKLHN